MARLASVSLLLPFRIAKGLPNPFATDLLGALLVITRNTCLMFPTILYHVACQTRFGTYIGNFTGVLEAA
jgi:hypothetical protein